MTAKNSSLHLRSAKGPNRNSQLKLAKSVNPTPDTALRPQVYIQHQGGAEEDAPRASASPDCSALCRVRQLEGAQRGSKASLGVLGISADMWIQDQALESKFLYTSPGGGSRDVRNWKRGMHASGCQG